ncbi:MAG: hypothetical protein JRD89_20320 [Deltaproteobacteria bacterium]|nr:hypothetical protein [Deltaproteobacteria bacterium]
MKGKGMQFSHRVWGDEPVGKTKTGEAIYKSILGHYAVEFKPGQLALVTKHGLLAMVNESEVG